MAATAKKTTAGAAKKPAVKKTTAGAAKKPAAKKPADKKTAAVKKSASSAKKPALKKTTAPRKNPVTKTPIERRKAEKKPVNTLTMQVVELCEQVAYDRKGENILRLDMTAMETAQSDYYILCTGLSEPHISAIAERIRRDVRERLDIRPIAFEGDRRSGWMIIDFGHAIVHVMTPDAREKYQLEELWGEVPRLDVVAKLDKEAEARRAAAAETAEKAAKASKAAKK